MDITIFALVTGASRGHVRDVIQDAARQVC
jgi:hypothetical protein